MTPELTPHGPVDIRLPPDPSLSRVLRLAASGMASLAGFGVDEIEDIKVAVSELLLALIENGDGEPIEVRFCIDLHGFEARGRTAVVAFDPQDPDLDLCRIVLAEVCTDHSVEFLDGCAHVRASVAHVPVE